MNTPTLTDSNVPAPGRKRRNRGSEVVRGALINAAIGEFATHGFEGASTRRIAEEADAHQSQIKYHFDTKDELWKRCIALLINEVDDEIAKQFDQTSTDARVVFEATVRGLVSFAARRPELSRMMMHEAMSQSDRLRWLVDTKLRDRHASLTQAWSRLVDDGQVPAIHPDLLYHTIIGASSLIYANAPEAELLGIDPSNPDLIQQHADTLVALFLQPRGAQ